MSRFRYVILPRLLLALSALALLAALFLLWLSLERPLPSIALACRQAGPANCFTGGEVIASGPIRLNYAEPDADAWAVLRSGDQYAMTNLKRTAGVLWTVPQFSLALFSLEDGQQLFPCPTGSFPYYFYREGTDSWGGRTLSRKSTGKSFLWPSAPTHRWCGWRGRSCGWGSQRTPRKPWPSGGCPSPGRPPGTACGWGSLCLALCPPNQTAAAAAPAPSGSGAMMPAAIWSVPMILRRSPSSTA